MNSKNKNILWAIALIVAGLFFLAEEMGIISDLPSLFWVAFLSGLSLVFFASYFLEGVRSWWWLLPAMACGAVAITIGLDEAGYNGSYIAAPIMAAIAIPFIVAYGIDTQNNWWALIPAWVMGVMTVVVLIADYAAGELVGTIVMFGVGLPFLFVYLTDRRRWWALIPAGVMGVTGLIPLLAAGLGDELTGPVVLFLFSVPFVVVYFWNTRNWWALIPAGVFATIGMVALLSEVIVTSASMSAVITGVLFFGLGLTFAVLWLRRAVHPTDWAKYPAVGLGIAGLIAFAFGPGGVRYITPLFIIGAGAILLLLSFRRRRA